MASYILRLPGFLNTLAINLMSSWLSPHTLTGAPSSGFAFISAVRQVAPAYMASARKAIKERVRKYYNKLEIDRIYHELYVTFIAYETMSEDERVKRAEQEAA